MTDRRSVKKRGERGKGRAATEAYLSVESRAQTSEGKR